MSNVAMDFKLAKLEPKMDKAISDYAKSLKPWFESLFYGPTPGPDECGLHQLLKD